MTAGVHHVEMVMGMAVSIDVREPLPSDGGVERLVDWLHHVDDTFSTYRDDSEITRWARGEIGIEQLNRDLEDVLLRCIDLTDVTGGAFDAFAVPAPNGTSIDPSGYVKGWAIERAASLLEHAGAANFCINAGGDIAVRGEPAPGDPWRIGIRHPDVAGTLATILTLRGPIAIATSATYERGLHIVDPRTGVLAADVASATIVGPDLGMADAFATAVFVMGLDGLDWIEGIPDYDAYVVAHDQMTYWSRCWPNPTPRIAT